MIRFAEYKEDFSKLYKKEKRKVVVYGAGNGLRQYFDFLPEISYICDKNAENIKEFQGIKVCCPSALKDEQSDIYIIVSVCDNALYKEIGEEIQKYDVNAVVFHLFNNVAFGYCYWNTTRSYRKESENKKLRVNIVCTEEAWIFKKFADRMYERLVECGVDVTVSRDTRNDVDVNHHIPYISYKTYKNDTLMITHVDTAKKIAMLKKQLETAGMGICMSEATLNQLVVNGVAREKLCYINPAQDNVIKPRKYVIGITHRCYDKEDLRKRTSALLEVLDGVKPEYFSFLIMGSGWEEVIEQMEKMGFEVTYYPDFAYDRYIELMRQIDYFLYMGFDEGTMGYLDALAAGVGTIVTPQGYHLDVDCPIDYPCKTVKQFKESFLDLQRKREVRVWSVSDWTWDNYVMKHLEIWNYLLKRKDLKEIYKNQLCYSDGIFSVQIEDNRI